MGLLKSVFFLLSDFLGSFATLEMKIKINQRPGRFSLKIVYTIFFLVKNRAV